MDKQVVTQTLGQRRHQEALRDQYSALHNGLLVEVTMRPEAEGQTPISTIAQVTRLEGIRGKEGSTTMHATTFDGQLLQLNWRLDADKIASVRATTLYELQKFLKQ
jgi:hypothetical protein